jgi:iron-sulfur cluster assembly accessory protein
MSFLEKAGLKKKKVVQYNPTGVTVTPSALAKIKEMCEEAAMPAVRPFVAGGSCAGMAHSMTFADTKERLDTEIAPHVYIDPVAYAFMDGATIDYEDDGIHASFVFRDVFKEQGGTGMCGGCGAATGPGYSPH